MGVEDKETIMSSYSLIHLHKRQSRNSVVQCSCQGYMLTRRTCSCHFIVATHPSAYTSGSKLFSSLQAPPHRLPEFDNISAENHCYPASVHFSQGAQLGSYCHCRCHSWVEMPCASPMQPDCEAAATEGGTLSLSSVQFCCTPTPHALP